MRLQTKLVAVRKIQSTVPRSNFSTADLESAAQAILQGQGTINPLILRQLDWQSYQVVNDHFGYYAAVRARELDLATGEMIQAIILEEENEGAILAQVKFFREPGTMNPDSSERDQRPDPLISTPSTPPNLDPLTPILDNLERHLITQIQAIQPQESPKPMIESLERRLMAQIEIIQTQQRALQKQMIALMGAIAPLPLTTTPSVSPPSPTAPPKINLNTATITDLCRIDGLGKKTAERIIQYRSTQGGFRDLQQLMEVEGIKLKTFNKYAPSLTVE